MSGISSRLRSLFRSHLDDDCSVNAPAGAASSHRGGQDIPAWPRLEYWEHWDDLDVSPKQRQAILVSAREHLEREPRYRAFREARLRDFGGSPASVVLTSLDRQYRINERFVVPRKSIEAVRSAYVKYYYEMLRCLKAWSPTSDGSCATPDWVPRSFGPPPLPDYYRSPKRSLEIQSAKRPFSPARASV